MNIAVIGDIDTVTGFELAGVKGYAVKPQDASQTLEKLVSEGIELIIITEKIAAFVQDISKKYESSATPILVEIPDKKGSTGFAEKMVSDMVRRAVGLEIIGGKE